MPLVCSTKKEQIPRELIRSVNFAGPLPCANTGLIILNESKQYRKELMPSTAKSTGNEQQNGIKKTMNML